MINEVESTVYRFEEFSLDAGKRLLSNGGLGHIPLTPKVFDTLLYLVRHPGAVIGKDELMSAIWTDTIVEENNLNKNISALRRVLGENRGDHRFIATIPGKGYKFVADVSINEATGAHLTGVSDRKGRERKSFQRVLAAAGVTVIVVATLFNAYYLRPKDVSGTADNLKTLAILPFRPLVAEDRDEALELGMADTLISRLGNDREMVVRPLSSVRRFGDMEQDALAAGRALGVDSVLDGNIQHWGDKIRVNVRFIKVSDGTTVWTETFDEKFTDILAVQDAIARRVATALSLRGSGDLATASETRYTNSPAAYSQYVRGRFHAYKVTEADLLKAIGFYELAIAADPNYGLAYAAMADAYRTLASAAFSPSKDVCPQAKALAIKALAIDDSIAEAHMVLGWIEFLFEWDWKSAEREFRRALELSPNNSDAHRALAHFLSNAGRHDEAINEARSARELAPLTLITAALEAQFLFYAGRDEEAIDRAHKTLEIDPNFWVAHNLLGRAYFRQGRLADSVGEFRIAKEMAKTSTEPLMQLGYALAKSGERDGALGVIRELETFSKTEYVPAYNFAMIYNGLGEREKALSHLAKSVDEREIQLAFIRIDSRWETLHEDPRFVELVRRMNLDR